jgi:Amt family ammonium transporter
VNQWGTIATGLFAATAINAAGPNGLFYGNPAQLGIQTFAVVIVALFEFCGSYVLLKIVNAISPLRVSEKEEDTGLDVPQHGEEAYA